MKPLAVIAIGTLAASCGLVEEKMPAVAGPSELALSLSLAANPDTLPADGVSISVITLVARDAAGRPVSDLEVWVDLDLPGVAAEVGRLSSTTVKTDARGRAVVIYTVPRRPAIPGAVAAGDGEWIPGADRTAEVISIVFTPVGTDYSTATGRTVHIRLRPV